MKKMKRTPEYKASNLVFNYEKMEAWSYGWWKFVTILTDGSIVFNGHNYSNTTIRHQRKVREVMRTMHIGPTIYIETRLSLSNDGCWNDALANFVKDISSNLVRANNKRVKKSNRVYALETAQYYISRFNKTMEAINRNKISVDVKLPDFSDAIESADRAINHDKYTKIDLDSYINGAA